MWQRCPSSVVVGPATLIGYGFFIMAAGYASIRREPRASVAGLLWHLALADVPALDRYEDVASGLYAKRLMPVRTADGKSRQAVVYVGRNTRLGVPKPGYMESVVAAAEACGLLDSHLQILRAFVPRSRHEKLAIGRSATRD